MEQSTREALIVYGDSFFAKEQIQNIIRFVEEYGERTYRAYQPNLSALKSEKMSCMEEYGRSVSSTKRKTNKNRCCRVE